MSRVFNSVGEIPKYKQSWESMRASIVPVPVNQITAAREGNGKEGDGRVREAT